MSINLPTHYVEQFSGNVQLLLQQQGSRLRSAVMYNGGYVGKQASPVDQIGAIAAQRVTGRFQPMDRVDAPTDRRWVFPVDYDLPQLIDRFDKLRLLTDPSSAYVTNAVNAMGRAEDDEIIAAFHGTSKTGEQGATSTTFPSTQVVGVNTGGTASNLNVQKLRAARKILRANEADLDNDPMYMGVTATEEDSLLNEIQIVSTDYNEKPVLVDGKVRAFLGFNFIHSERFVTGTDDQSGTSRSIPAWIKSGMHLGGWGGEWHTSITQRNDLRGEPWQAYVCMTVGATRTEEKKVVRVWCR